MRPVRLSWRRPPSLVKPIVVVDQRTYRHAERALAARIDADCWVQAKFCATAMWQWLHREITTGPKRHRVARAAAQEQLEATIETINCQLGLTADA